MCRMRLNECLKSKWEEVIFTNSPCTLAGRIQLGAKGGGAGIGRAGGKKKFTSHFA